MKFLFEWFYIFMFLEKGMEDFVDFHIGKFFSIVYKNN